MRYLASLRLFASLLPSKRLPVPLLLSAWACAASQAFAAAPDAGQILQEPRAPQAVPTRAGAVLGIDTFDNSVAPEGGVVVKLRDVRFSGNTAFDSQTLQGLVSDSLGRDQSFADLDRLIQRISRHYRRSGFLVARAYLPAQEVRDGVLEIVVLEGKFGQLQVSNTAGLKDAALAPLHGLPLDEPIHSATLERSLLNMSDLPGTRVQAVLRPGATVGSSDLLVEVSAAQAFQGSADMDNFGSHYTGTNRLGSSLYWNNPLDRGDQLSLRIQASDASMNYTRVAYQLPSGSYGARIGLALSHVDYHLGKEFALLDAGGQADTASLYLRQPLQRSRTNSWYAQVQLDAKNLQDTAITASTHNTQQLRNVVGGFSGDWQDGWLADSLGAASNTWAVNLTRGGLILDASSALQDAASAQTAGTFNKLGYQFERQQLLNPTWSLGLSLSGQVADKNLASAEKFSLGGSNGVRAFAQSDGLGDAGWLAKAALRWHLAPGWLAQVFYDAGSVRINQRPWSTNENEKYIAGAGLTLGWATDKWSFSLTSAWATEGQASDGLRGERHWAQASVAF